MPHTKSGRPENASTEAPRDPARSGAAVFPAEENRITYAEYKARRRACFSASVPIAAFLLLVCAFPAYIIWAAVDTFDGSGTSAFVCVLAVGIAAAVIAALLFLAGKLLKESFDMMKEEKKRFRRNAPPPELRRAKRRSRVCTAALCVLLCGATAWLIGGKAAEAKKLNDTYTAALALSDQERYTAARELLRSIQDEAYRDTDGLITLCTAHIKYSSGDLYGAYYELDGAEFRSLTEAQQKAVETFRKELSAAVKKKRAEAAAAQKKQIEENIKNGVPYVGLPESRIGGTSLGAPSVTEHDDGVLNGQRCTVTDYYWYRSGGVIFYARCVERKVIRVNDYRNAPITRNKKSSSPKKSDAWPDPDDYMDAEDLYDWYYDDFYDYEEAEEYLENHGWD